MAMQAQPVQRDPWPIPSDQALQQRFIAWSMNAAAAAAVNNAAAPAGGRGVDWDPLIASQLQLGQPINAIPVPAQAVPVIATPASASKRSQARSSPFIGSAETTPAAAAAPGGRVQGAVNWDPVQFRCQSHTHLNLSINLSKC
jgi:hypothetical protein